MNIMTKRGSEDNIVTYEHYCDTKADLANIPQDQISLGSVAIVLKDEDDSMGIYLANSNKEWISFSAGGGGSESSIDDGGSGGDFAGLVERTIASVDNSEITTVGDEAFAYCTNLISVNLPACTTVGNGAFSNCTNLTNVNLPLCTNVPRTMFAYCTSLQSIFLPACISIAEYASAFGGCSNLTTVNMPVAQSIPAYTFFMLSKLTTVSFPACTTIGERAFGNCTKLASAYFLGSSVPTLNLSAFADSGMGDGSIYVRASLLSEFKSATNWSALTADIIGLTDEEIAELDANN